MSFSEITDNVERYYSERVTTHGATAKGVDWNSSESQNLRFDQLLKVVTAEENFSLNDYGCGYGALAGYLVEQGQSVRYSGFDLSTRMIAEAHRLYQGQDGCEFFAAEAALRVADYTVASGIFNVKLQTGEEEWQAYVLHTLDRIATLSRKGFAFNLLTSYSDKEFMRPDLYYADPRFFFDYCKTHFSKYVTLLHDYPLYEWTMLVKKPLR